MTSISKAFPKGMSISGFLSNNNMSADNVKQIIAVYLRRKAMDTYQQSLVVSPTKQVHFELIHIDLSGKAKDVLAQIKKDPTQWNALAKANSLDSDTRDVGGDQGWVFIGQKDQAVERWVFSHNVGEISPVIKDINNTYNIVKILEIDNQRVIASDQLQTYKGTALSHWLTGRNSLDAKISARNDDMFNSPYNVPVTPSFNVTFPTPNAGVTGP
jgi:hypothetical protein